MRRLPWVRRGPHGVGGRGGGWVEGTEFRPSEAVACGGTSLSLTWLPMWEAVYFSGFSVNETSK